MFMIDGLRELKTPDGASKKFGPNLNPQFPRIGKPARMWIAPFSVLTLPVAVYLSLLPAAVPYATNATALKISTSTGQPESNERY